MVGTLFHRNLKVLLTYMVETGAVSTFYSDSVGLGSDQVYGQLLCRGDVSVDVCWNCSAQASTKIQELCPNSRSGIVWLDLCQLRYSDVNFAGAVDVHDGACRPAVSNSTMPASFNQNLRILNGFFATGKLQPDLAGDAELPQWLLCYREGHASRFAMDLCIGAPMVSFYYDSFISINFYIAIEFYLVCPTAPYRFFIFG
ncbi:unnamed protein product [Victoria cruziana]